MTLEKQKVNICKKCMYDIMSTYENDCYFKNEYKKLQETKTYQNFIENTSTGKETDNILVGINNEYSKMIENLNMLVDKTQKYLYECEKNNNINTTTRWE